MEMLLINHGGTSASSDFHLIDKHNSSLSIEGISDLLDKKASKVYESVDSVFSSPLRSCVETCHIIYPSKPHVLVKSLCKKDMGVFAGKNADYLAETKSYTRFVETAGKSAPPGGEGEEHFTNRIRNAVSHVATESQKQNYKKIAIVTHGDCIMSIMSTLSSDEFGGVDKFEYQAPHGLGHHIKLNDTFDQIVWSELI